MDFRKMTVRCLEAISIAQAFAVRRGHAVVDESHLVLALCTQEDGILGSILEQAGKDCSTIVDLLERHLEELESTPVTQTRIGADVEAIFDKAASVASSMSSSVISSAHVLSVCLSSETLCGELLRSSGVSRARLQMSAGVESLTAGPSENLPPTLKKYGRDLTLDAARGDLEPIIGRDDEIRRTIQTLMRRSKNNPILIGEPGVGKTALVEAVAQRIVRGDVPDGLRGRRVVSIDLGAMVAGTIYRGMFEERLTKVVCEAEQSNGRVIVFIDEVHTLLGAGSTRERSLDAANMLKPALARGSLRVIAATTTDEYRRYFARDAALERRFQPIHLDEPTVEETVVLLRALKTRYEAHYRIRIGDDALLASAKLSHRYIGNRRLPDKAIDLLDEASSARRVELDRVPAELEAKERHLIDLEIARQSAHGNELEREVAELRTEAGWMRARWQQAKDARRDELDDNDVAEVVSRWSGVPVTRIVEDEATRLTELEPRLREQIVGQPEAARVVAQALVRARTGVKSAERPIGSFLFVGPTGVGKTEMAKVLAREMFGEDKGLVRIQMSEFSDGSSVSRLIGAAPGYIGYESGGVLTEAVRNRAHAVILFDEFEKAHREVQNLLLQVLDEGHLTDAGGQTVDFRNTIMILTSNLAVGSGGGSGIGFGNEGSAASALEKHLPRETINRFDAIVPFQSMTTEHMKDIVEIRLKELSKRLLERGVRTNWADSIKLWLAEKGCDPMFGARPLRRLIESRVETELASKLLGGVAGGVAVSFENGDVVVDALPVVAAERDPALRLIRELQAQCP